MQRWLMGRIQYRHWWLANPYITILGPIESGAKRIAIMGIANKTARGDVIRPKAIRRIN